MSETNSGTIKEQAAKIVDVLPKENCGKCGFPNCGSFAVAAAKIEASAFGCHKHPSSGFKISEILGIEVSEADREKVLSHRGHHGDHGCGMHGHGHMHQLVHDHHHHHHH